jgi:hypothetical protein
MKNKTFEKLQLKNYIEKTLYQRDKKRIKN